MSNNKTNATNQETNDTLSIVVKEPEKFGNVLETEYITSQKLAEKINGLFAGVFADYHGCVVTPNPNYPSVIDLTLYFRPTEGLDASGKYTAFQKTGVVTRAASIVDRLNSIDSRFRSSKSFELTQEAAELLHEFFAGNSRLKMEPKDYEKNKLVTEVTEQQGYNRFILCAVIGLDINRVVSKLYGQKNAAGDSVEYMVSPVRPLGNIALTNTTQAMNWIISIARVSKPQIDKISSELGLLASGGSIPIVTANRSY